MPVIKVNGLVTHRADYRDSDRMLSILTAEEGLLSAAARGCRRQNSPLIAASELFTYGEFVLEQRQGRSTVKTFEAREGFYPIRQDVIKLAAGAHILELINAGTGEGEGSGLLPLAYYALSYLAYTDQEPRDIAVCFGVKCLAGMGYTPSVTSCARCMRDMRGMKRMGFSPTSGGAVCPDCMREGDAAVSALSMEAMRRMLLLSPEEMNKVRLPQSVRKELMGAVGRYAECVTERRMKALRQLEAAAE